MDSSKSLVRVLRELQEKIDHSLLLTEDESYSGLFEVYLSLTECFVLGDLPAQQLLQALGIAENTLKALGGRVDRTDVKMNRLYLGIHATEATARKMLDSKATVTGTWEAIVWKLVSLVAARTSNFLNYRTKLQPSPYLKRWVLQVFCDEEMCPNIHLRLEMFHLIALWKKDELQSSEIGSRVVSGLIETSLHLRLHHLLPVNDQPCLTFSFSWVLYGLNKFGHLATVASASVEGVKNFIIGPETRCLVHLVEIIGRMADKTRQRCEAVISVSPPTILALESMYYNLMILIATPSVDVAWTSPGLAQKAASAIITATSSLLAVAPAVYTTDPLQHERIMEYVEGLFSTLSHTKNLSYLCWVLRREHSQALFRITELAKTNGYLSLNIPKPYEDEVNCCPVEFVDSITQLVMVDPVKLLSSNMMVDESTLVQLLMTSSVDPFTRCPLSPASFCRDPDLRQKIASWREGNVCGKVKTANLGSDATPPVHDVC